MKCVVLFVILFIFIHRNECYAQLQIADNTPNTFLVPPSFDAPRKFRNNVLQVYTKYTRLPFIRNLKNNNNFINKQEHQTDWIPILPPPTYNSVVPILPPPTYNSVMEKKQDRIYFKTEVLDQITLENKNRKGKILIRNDNEVVPTKAPFKTNEFKTIDKRQEQQNKQHSFVYYQKLLNKQSNDDGRNNKTRNEFNEMTKLEIEENKDDELGKIFQAKLDDLLKKFEGNLSKILDNAITNVSEVGNERNRVQRGSLESPVIDIHRSNGGPIEFLQPVRQFNDPPTSGTSTPGLISSSYWADPPTDAGYTSPPNLNLDSNSGTLDYTIEHGGTQEIIHGTTDSTTHRSILRYPSLNNDNNWNHNSDDNKFNTNVNSQIRINDYKSQTEDSNRKSNDRDLTELNENFDTIQSNIKNNNITKRIEVNDEIFEPKVKRKITELNEPNENILNERNTDEDGRVEETIVRDNRVSKRMYPFYTSVDLKGINAFHSNNNNHNDDLIDNIKGINLLALDQFRRGHKINLGYNSLDHLPPDPLVSLFLSHYGRYIPRGHALSSNFRNIYSYLASNNIHNNKPFGAYKIYEDTDG